MTDQLITESSCTAVVKAPIEFVDIPTWLFNLPDAQYQRCSPAQIAGAASTSDNGRRLHQCRNHRWRLIVEHYVEEIGEKGHCRVLSTSDVLTPTGWTKIKVTWELTVKAIDKDSCELTNRVIGRSTPEFMQYLAKSGIPFDAAKQSLAVSAPAHNVQETPFFAASIEKKALEAQAATGK